MRCCHVTTQIPKNLINKHTYNLEIKVTILVKFQNFVILMVPFSKKKNRLCRMYVIYESSMPSFRCPYTENVLGNLIKEANVYDQP